MKKLTALLLTGVLALGMTACGGTPENNSSANAGTEAPEENMSSKDAKTYTVTFNANEGNVENMPEYQFLSGNMKGMLNNDSRLHVDVTLNLDGNTTYELESDCYVIEGGKTAEVGDETGIGMEFHTKATGTYKTNDDGTVEISIPDHVAHVLTTDTYSSQMKDAAGIRINGNKDDGEWDSDDEPAILELIPETIFTLSEDGSIVSYSYLHPENIETGDEGQKEGEDTQAEEPSLGSELLAIPSDDTGTTFTLTDNGTYEFVFPDYGISDIGSYVYDAESSTLTLTDANGKETVSSVDGDNVVFHYEYSQSDQLTGDYTVAAAELEAALQ